LPAGRISRDGLAAALGDYAAASPTRNLTIDALLAALPEADPGEPEAVVPFSSRTRWSGVQLDGRTLVLGAPELFGLGPLTSHVARESGAGRRVLALMESSAPLAEAADGGPPTDLEPLGLAVLSEELRPDTRETVAYLLEQGVELRVISGDAPATVGAIAADAGIPLADGPVDGRELPENPEDLDRALDRARVVGRISPEGKKRYVETLAARGNYVAMVGDGVNDVPALKASRLAIAQGSGSQMARAISDIVLVKGGFETIPPMIAEGRKLLRNLQRVAKLFVAKSVLAAFLILTVGLAAETAYPFQPRHLTLASAVTIGIPTVVLALAPSQGPWKPDNFLRELARFAVPAGTAAGLGVVASYLLALNLLDLSQTQASTVATTVLVGVGLYLVLVLESSTKVRSYLVGGMVAGLLALYFVVLAVPSWREFFDVATPGPAVLLPALAGVAISIGGLIVTDERFVPYRARPVEEAPAS
ncbi:MAG: HAD-IC family P-type ATPase, partial [Miltoncostaeaceae bacterium]